MTTRAEQFLAAKQALRAHPDWDDEKVAEEIGVKLVDTPGLATIRAARRDLGAGEPTGPELRP